MPDTKPPNRQRTPLKSSNKLGTGRRCSMSNWFMRVFRRPFRSRRAVLVALLLFAFTTGLLYVLVELYTTTTDSPNPSSSITTSTNSPQTGCQLGYEATRAIRSARTDYCKEQLREIACRIEAQPDFYPRSLPRFCPLQDGRFGEIVGCVSIDANSTRAGRQGTNSTSSIACTDYCLKLEYPLAEYNVLSGKCLCFFKFDDPERLTLPNVTCPDNFARDEELGQNFATLYRTSYHHLGNQLEKRSPNENDTRPVIVFFLTVGGRRNLRQIQRLLRTIYTEQHFYLIHVDVRDDYLQYELAKLETRFSNIRLTTKRYATTWGASTLLNAHVDAFKQIFEELRWNFSFVINLSESDLPIKSIRTLTNVLASYPSHNFLRSHGQNPLQFQKAQGMFYSFVHCNNHMYRITERNLTSEIVYDGGSDWYALNRQFIHYVTYGDDELINGLRHIFNYTLLPCETFFHVLLSNSIYCSSYIRNNLRLVHWDRVRGCKCQHLNVVDWCGCSPVVYKSHDLQDLRNRTNQPLFFARKFDPTIDEAIIDWLDERVSQRNLSNGAYYLQNIYHSMYGGDRLGDKLKLIDGYARAILGAHGRDDGLQLKQIHFVYDMSEFQGYAVQYRSSSGEQLEMFVKLNTPNGTDYDVVKRLDVGHDADKKELVFTDRTRMFLEPDLIEVVVEWESLGKNDTELIISDPDGVIYERIKLKESREPLVFNMTFPEDLPTSSFGIWRMVIVEETNGALLADSNFLIIPSSDGHSAASMAEFWPAVSLCSTAKNSTLGNASTNRTIPITLIAVDDCDQQPWSVFFFDEKSQW